MHASLSIDRIQANINLHLHKEYLKIKKGVISKLQRTFLLKSNHLNLKEMNIKHVSIQSLSMQKIASSNNILILENAGIIMNIWEESQ